MQPPAGSRARFPEAAAPLQAMGDRPKPRFRTVPMPAWYDLHSKDEAGLEYVKNSLTDGDLIEFKIGRGADEQGVGLFVAGKAWALD